MKIINPIHSRIKEIVSCGKTKEDEFIFYSFRFEDIKFNMDMDNESKKLLKLAFMELGLTEAQLDFIERCALSIAKLDNKKQVEAVHIAEAIQYGVEYHLKVYMKDYLKSILK